jgi:hypothetical protein
MNIELLRSREAILANGDRVNLLDAAVHHGQLSAQIALEDSEWDVVYHLRQVCLGHEIDREPKALLIQEGWLNKDGTPKPALRSVVLSSVRGEQRALHIDLPYTDPLDRALAEFFNNREFLLSELESADVSTLFEKPALELTLSALSEEFNRASKENPALDGETWFADRLRKIRGQDGDSPGTSSRGFPR